jgi:hypothetical protein
MGAGVAGGKMIYVEADLAVWKRKYGLEPEEYHCSKCGKVFLTTIPFLMKGHAGLQSQPHDCGRTYVLYHLIPRTEEGRESWNKIV